MCNQMSFRFLNFYLCFFHLSCPPSTSSITRLVILLPKGWFPVLNIWHFLVYFDRFWPEIGNLRPVKTPGNSDVGDFKNQGYQVFLMAYYCQFVIKNGQIVSKNVTLFKKKTTLLVINLHVKNNSL